MSSRDEVRARLFEASRDLGLYTQLPKDVASDVSHTITEYARLAENDIAELEQALERADNAFHAVEEKLRLSCNVDGGFSCVECVEQAIDKMVNHITELEAELNTVVQTVQHELQSEGSPPPGNVLLVKWICGDARADIDKMKAENDRLRQSLREHTEQLVKSAARVAELEAALAQQKETDNE